MYKRFRFLVLRSQEPLGALVSGRISEEVLTSELSVVKQIRARIFRAVGIWLAQTVEGRSAWLKSCTDFNVGDLTLINLWELKSILKQEGIVDLDVFGIDVIPEDVWVFDDIIRPLERND